MTYSYDPAMINDRGLNQMRFELGDIMVSGGEETCALCDEEYTALLERETVDGKVRWKSARFQVLYAIFIRFSYEVDYSADNMSLKLAQRWERWKWMYEQAVAEKNVPPVSALPQFGKNQLDGGHYFRKNLHRNPTEVYRREWADS